MRQKPQLPFLLERALSKAPFDLMKRIIGENAQQVKAKKSFIFSYYVDFKYKNKLLNLIKLIKPTSFGISKFSLKVRSLYAISINLRILISKYLPPSATRFGRFSLFC